MTTALVPEQTQGSGHRPQSIWPPRGRSLDKGDKLAAMASAAGVGVRPAVFERLHELFDLDISSEQFERGRQPARR